MKKKLAAALTSIAVTGAGLSVGTAPAQAVSTTTITAPDISVTNDACGRSEVTINGDWTDDAHNSVVTTVTGPQGDDVTDDYSMDERSGSISLPVELCGYYDTPGSYTVSVEAEGSDENYENATSTSATETFTFTKVVPYRANTAITKKAKRLKGTYKWQVTGRLIRAGRGYARQRVAIQARIYGDWTYIAGTRTRGRGVFGWKFKPNSYTWRYVYYGNSITKPAASAAFRTPRKGRAGRVLVQDPRSVIS